jgi:two-component system CheB/CheR fusion protein
MIIFDIDEARRNSDRLKHAASYADAIIETVREPLLVLDGSLRVKRVTESFCEKFHLTSQAVEEHFLYEIGNHQWNIPALRTLLEEVLPKNARVTDFKVDHLFPKLGRRTLLLNARRVGAIGGDDPMIVLSIAEKEP